MPRTPGDVLIGLAAHQPVLAVYEDVHWADPTSLELLDLIVERVQGSPVLVLITFRSEFLPPWMGHPHVIALTLSRLRRQGADMVESLTVGRALPAEVLLAIDEAIDRLGSDADGAHTIGKQTAGDLLRRPRRRKPPAGWSWSGC